MQVITAKTAGFCFGVRRAVEKCYEKAAECGGSVYTYGPIIHNEMVVDDLEKHGVGVIGSAGELKSLKEGTVIIRSHGVPKEICDLIEAQGLNMVDATCPFVKKIHTIVREKSEQGYQIVVIGRVPQTLSRREPGGGRDRIYQIGQSGPVWVGRVLQQRA